ncbi:hypothetical protein D3C76_1724610 [compost metagenome]
MRGELTLRPRNGAVDVVEHFEKYERRETLASYDRHGERIAHGFSLGMMWPIFSFDPSQ